MGDGYRSARRPGRRVADDIHLGIVGQNLGPGHPARCVPGLPQPDYGRVTGATATPDPCRLEVVNDKETAFSGCGYLIPDIWLIGQVVNRYGPDTITVARIGLFSCPGVELLVGGIVSRIRSVVLEIGIISPDVDVVLFHVGA